MLDLIIKLFKMPRKKTEAAPEVQEVARSPLADVVEAYKDSPKYESKKAELERKLSSQ